MASKKVKLALLALAIFSSCLIIGDIIYVNWIIVEKVTEVIQLLSELGVKVNG